MEINRPEVVAEVTAAFQRYERALVVNDIPVLQETFWKSPLTIRYSLIDNAYGHDQIEASRLARPPGVIARSLERTVITTYGTDFATANTEFRRTETGRAGRQSQTWVRMPEGWRVVSAHVSWFTPPS